MIGCMMLSAQTCSIEKYMRSLETKAKIRITKYMLPTFVAYKNKELKLKTQIETYAGFS
jgi:hypothetical protein